MQKIRASYHYFIKNNDKIDKIKMLQEEDYTYTESSKIGAKKLVDDISKAIENSRDKENPIKWEHIIQAIEEIQKKENNDLTTQKKFIENVVLGLNISSKKDKTSVELGKLGSEFEATVSFLAKHRHHTFNSKINWFGQINKTNGIKGLIERCSRYQDCQSVETFSDGKKYNLLDDISSAKFLTDPRMLTKLAESIGKEKWTDPGAQRHIARAIFEQKFGTDKEVLTKLAESIGKEKWTDPGAQRHIAQAISEKKFGQDPEVLAKLAESISTIDWTYPWAQWDIAQAIFGQKFGDNTEVLSKLAESISTIDWTYPEAQKTIVKAIYYRKFGNNQEVLTKLANYIITIQWTDSEVQKTIAQAIFGQKFGDNPEVLAKLAVSVGTTGWTDPEAQKTIAKAIYEQKFGTGKDALVNLALSSLKIKWDANDFNQIKIFILEIASAHFVEYDELKSAMDHIRQCHFTNGDIEKFDSQPDKPDKKTAALNARYAHKIRKASTMQELRSFFEAEKHNGTFDEYKEALDAFQEKFSELGLVNDQDDPEHRVEERFFLYRNPINKCFYFLNITGALTNALTPIDLSNPNFDAIFQKEFLNGISNKTISLYSLNGSEIEIFQVENKEHLIYFPIFMHEILNCYHSKFRPKIRLQSLIQENMISSVASDPRLISETQKAELRGIVSLAFADPKISSASRYTNLKQNYDFALTMKFLGESKNPEHADRAFQETVGKILDFCQSCFDKSTDISNYVDILMFSAFMFGLLSSAHVFGWHDAIENNSNQIFRRISLDLFKKLNEEIQTHKEKFLAEGFLTQTDINVLGDIVHSIGNTDRGIGICIGQTMDKILFNERLFIHIRRFFES